MDAACVAWLWMTLVRVMTHEMSVSMRLREYVFPASSVAQFGGARTVEVGLGAKQEESLGGRDTSCSPHSRVPCTTIFTIFVTYRSIYILFAMDL